MGINDVLKKELELISVPESEVLRLESVASDFVKSLKREGLRAFIGGSLAKGTMIRKENAQDVDVFVVFDYSEDILKLEGILRKMKLPGELRRVHGSRDYFHVLLDSKYQAGQANSLKIVLEIVPVVENHDPELAENVTDVSLSHVKYVVSEIEKNPGLSDEIKLAKAFCRAQRCYGAESYVRGFSGYSLEVLVIHFGGFVKFLKGVLKKRVVDPMKYFRGEREIMREINSSKLQGPLVVVDPTYKYRNVCAGLGLETFERFLEVSGDFLKRPSLEFFERKEVDVEGLRALVDGGRKTVGGKRRFLELELFSDRQEGDIAGTKMRKILRFFERELVRAGQEVLRSEFDYCGRGQKAKGYLVVVEREFVERRGPSVGLERASRMFCEANEGCYRKKGFWWVKKRVLVEGVLEGVLEKSGEMGAGLRLV